MKTTFATRHFEPGRDLKSYSLSEVSRLEQFFDRIISCDIVLEPNEDHDNPCRAELRVQVPKKLLHATEAGQSWEQAVNSAVDTIVRQIRKYKTRNFEHH